MVDVHVEVDDGEEEEAQPAPKPVPKVSAWGARQKPPEPKLRPKPKVLPKQRPKEPAEPPPKPAEKARPKPRPDTGRQVASKAMPAEKTTLMKPRPKCRPVSATTSDEANWQASKEDEEPEGLADIRSEPAAAKARPTTRSSEPFLPSSPAKGQVRSKARPVPPKGPPPAHLLKASTRDEAQEPPWREKQEPPWREKEKEDLETAVEAFLEQHHVEDDAAAALREAPKEDGGARFGAGALEQVRARARNKERKRVTWNSERK
ncbi:unnamed protein product [Symbiodinium sp. CCMP2592]|nr:unnamed protein product [Symbiodinium sp. CCMP2592]